jgi:hypothetical protein
MGKLIAPTQATVDGVVDPVGEWVQPDGDHGDYSFERQARSSGLALGRKTYEGLAGYWPSQSGRWAAYALAETGLIDEYEIYLNPLVWGEGNVHVLGDRGTVRMALDSVKRFDSGWSCSPISRRPDRGSGASIDSWVEKVMQEAQQQHTYRPTSGIGSRGPTWMLDLTFGTPSPTWAGGWAT